MFERVGLTKQEQIESMMAELAEPNVVKSASLLHGKNSSRRKKFSFLKMLFYLVIVSSLLLILSNILISKSKGEIPNFFGFYVFSVESASMAPTLMVGDLVLSKKLKNFDNLEVGSIVTFKNVDGKVVTHRIIKLTKDHSGVKGYITKGDNPINSPDKDILTPNRILAVLINKVPFS